MGERVAAAEVTLPGDLEGYGRTLAKSFPPRPPPPPLHPRSGHGESHVALRWLRVSWGPLICVSPLVKVSVLRAASTQP